MEFGEAWLLETLAMYRLPVSRLTRCERSMNKWLNRGYHRLSRTELVQTLARLFEQGDIDAYHETDCYNPASLEELIGGLGDSECTLHCGATRKGGNRWEQLAEPVWARYFEDCGWDGEYVEITAATRERLNELVSNADILWHCRMSVAREGITELSVWEPFLWKTLPRGFRANVRYERIRFSPKSREEVIREHRRMCSRQVELRTWATSICGNAYV